MKLWTQWIAAAMLMLAVAGGDALAGTAQPATAPQSGAIAAADFPIPIRYTVPEAGNVVVVIDDAQGRRVRNLLAEAPRAAGDHVDLWDGCDDDGKTVKPGSYHFKAAVTPVLNLSYEFTVNNSGDPPWWKQDVWEPRPNPGGWMADHTPPQGAAAAGDKVFLGSEAAEHGHSLIAVDLTGRKVWGAKWLELAGSRCVCSDGKTIYSAGEGSWVGTHMKLFAIDPNNFAIRRIADVDFGSGPLAGLGNLTGLTASDGQVYASFSPPQKGIGAIAFDPAAIDWANTSTHGLPAAQFIAILRGGETGQPWMNLPLDAAKQEPLRIAWKADQNIGTILSPHRFDVSALRPDAHYPGDLTNDADWIAFNADMSSPAMKVYTSPPDARTRALRIRVLNAVAPLRLDQPQTSLKDNSGPASSFVGLRAVGSRLHALDDRSGVAVSSGRILEGDAWDNHQERDITASNPATYTIQLLRPADISALLVRDPLFAKAHVELRAGPDAPWYPAGELIASFPWRRAYNDITLDFGRNRTVSAIRIVVTDPAVDQNSDVKKRTGLTHQVCGLGGVLLLATNPEPGPGQRISVYSAQNGALVRDIPITLPGALAFDPSGRLLAVSDGKVVSVSPTDGPVTPVIEAGLAEPTGLTCDTKGNIYVADSGDNVVKRFTSDGKPAGVIGKPGGIDPGPYDPERMSNPQGTCIDGAGRLWVAEAEMRPKKVSVWNLEGSKPKLERYFIGGPRYGSGFMYIDPREPSRFFFEGMEFHVNWETGVSEIKNIVWREGRGGAWQGVTCDRPVYVHDRLYLLGEPFWFYGNRYFAIARYDKDHAVPVAAAGKADEWPPLRDPAILQSLGNPDLTHLSFIWSDLNDNGKVDPGEVKLGFADLRLETAYFGARGGVDLTIQFANERFVPISFTPGGAPVYDFEHLTPTPALHPDGFGLYNTAITSTGDFIEVSDRIAMHDSKGQMRWSYPDHFNGVHGSAKAPPPQPGLLAGTLHVIGSATLPNIGEVFAVSTNKGEVCLFTTDGLWIARLFRDNRYGRGFNLPKAERGMNLNDVSLNTEHFGGTFNQLADGRIFLVAGHNHNSVIRLDGLDRVRRMEGNVVITDEQARAADDAAKESAVGGAEPKRLLIARSAGGFQIDGDLADWSKLAPVALAGTGEHQAKAWLAYDPEALLIAFDVRGTRGMVNHEKDWKLLFRAGDCVDLQLRIDRNSAPPGGQGAAGDLRIVITMQEGHPVAVIYRPVVAGTPADKKITFASPVGSVTFDVIEQIDLDVAVVERKDGYCLEAAIPWKTLGVKPVSGLKLLGDIGVLFADKEGLSTVERIYWSNYAAGLVADVPGEARLQPERWGEMELQ